MNALKLPEVTVIIPNYNRGYCLGRTIQSVIDQTFVDWELIVVDNRSTDNSLEVINSFKDDRINLIETSNNGIIARSRNLGIQKARGVYTAFLDSDDWWTPSKLEMSIECLKCGADLVHHDLYEITKLPFDEKQTGLISLRRLTNPVFEDLLCNGNAIINSSVVVRTDLIRAINGFSEEPQLVGSEDFDGWIRLSQITNKFCKLQSVLGFYWSGDQNYTSHRSIYSNLLFLHQRYKSSIAEVCGVEYPHWLLYSLARASLGLGQFADARKYAWLLLQQNVPYTRKIVTAGLLSLALIKVRL